MLDDEVRIVIAADDDEFRAVRRDLAKDLRSTPSLRLTVLDQADGDEPPLPTAERLDLARRADIVVVLLGARYADPPLGASRALAHLQYDEALASAHMSLVCLTVATPDERDPGVVEWEHRIARRVRLEQRAHDDPDLVVDLARRVRILAHTRLVSLGRLPEPGAPGSVPIVPIPTEVQRLLGERTGPDRIGPRLGHFGPRRPEPRIDPDADASREPARAAADEQWNEAVLAWAAGLWAPMATHLDAAHRHRPLDEEVALLLARTGLASGRADRATRALELADNIAAVASTRGEPRLAGSALLVAARAARIAGVDGTPYARSAHELIPDRAEPLVELAIDAAAADRWDDVATHAWAATQRYPDAIVHLAGHPVLAARPDELLAVVAHVRDQVIDRVRPIGTTADRLLDPETSGLGPIPRDIGLLELVEWGSAAADALLDETHGRADRLARAHHQLHDLRDRPPVEEEIGPPPGATADRRSLVMLGLAFLAGMLAVGLDVLGAFPWPVRFLAGAGVVLAFEARSRRAKQREHDARIEAAREAHARAQELHNHRVREVLDERRTAASRFRTAVADVEERALHWWCLLPTVEPDRADVGDLVRVRRSDPPDGARIDTALFSRDLRLETGVADVEADHLLCRVEARDDDGALELSHRRAYFNE